MARYAIVSAVLLVIITSLAYAQVPALKTREFGYIIDAANESVAALPRHRDIKPEELAKVANHACIALKKLAGDPKFRDLLKYYESHRDDPQAAQIIGKFDSFLNFLRQERTLLITHGVAERTADFAIAEFLRLREQLDAKNFEADRTLTWLNASADQACRVSQNAEDVVKQGQTHSKMIAVALGTVGGTALFIDGIVALEAPPIAVVSGIGGLAMVGASYFF